MKSTFFKKEDTSKTNKTEGFFNVTDKRNTKEDAKSFKDDEPRYIIKRKDKEEKK